MKFLSRLPSWRRHPLPWLGALCIALSASYWGLIASDRYVSEARITLARADLSSGQSMDFASLLGGASVANRSDQLLLRDHLRSLDMLRTIDAKLGLRQHYSGQGDWLSRLWRTDAPLEELLSFFQQKVSVELDEFSGVLVINAQAYTPEMAQAITATLVREGEKHMNALGHQLAQEQVRFLEQQVSRLAQRMHDTRSALLAFQNQKGLVSPMATAENAVAIVNRLEAQLAELQTRRTGLQSFLQPSAAQMQEVQAQIEAVQAQLGRERSRLAAGHGSPLNQTVEQYQRLQMDADFAQQVHNTALVSLERGRVDASRTLKQVQVLQSANRPESATQPRRLYNASIQALAVLLAIGVLQLLLAIVRDHQD